jgi:hypothetical protein
MLRRILVPLLCFLAPTAFIAVAHAEVDPRAEMKIQASPLECAAVWSRLQDVKTENEQQSDAAGRIGTACKFDEIKAKVDAAAKAKRTPTDADFAGPRITRALPRDALAALVDWLVPTKERPVALAQDAVFRKLRFEFREVLAMRDPYAPHGGP